jgi:hypothetical protein
MIPGATPLPNVLGVSCGSPLAKREGAKVKMKARIAHNDAPKCRQLHAGVRWHTPDSGAHSTLLMMSFGNRSRRVPTEG